MSAKATDVHPAVVFGGVLLGTALFGVASALLAVPVVAILLSPVQAFVRRHELVAALSGSSPDGSPSPDKTSTLPATSPGTPLIQEVSP